MSVSETQKIDAIAGSPDGENLILLITDHLPWDDLVEHLLVLHEKIENYVSFLETEQWKQVVPQPEKIKYCTILIKFKYDIPKTCESYLQTTQDRIGPMGILLKAEIVGENM